MCSHLPRPRCLSPLYLPGAAGSITAQHFAVPTATCNDPPASRPSCLPTGGSLALYLRYQQPPGEGETQHDLASDVAVTTTSSSWAREASVHLDLMRSDAAFRPGEPSARGRAGGRASGRERERQGGRVGRRAGGQAGGRAGGLVGLLA